jgi:hypothetical protein
MTPKRLVQRNDIGRFWLTEREALVESRQLYGVWMYELYRYTAGIDYIYLKKNKTQMKNISADDAITYNYYKTIN